MGLADALADMCQQSAVAMAHATRALLEADLHLAEQVIADDARIDDLRVAAEEKAFGLLALQAPVATDLRVVISAIHGAGDDTSRVYFGTDTRGGGTPSSCCRTRWLPTSQRWARSRSRSRARRPT